MNKQKSEKIHKHSILKRKINNAHPIYANEKTRAEAEQQQNHKIKICWDGISPSTK